MRVTNEIRIYEVDGKDAPSYDTGLVVHSHWNRTSMVVLETPDGKRYTVVAKELKAAIENATNTARF